MLIDKYNRTIQYLRISLTEACNLHCFYCRSDKNLSSIIPRQNYLKKDEIILITRAFSELGISHVRLSGGEPLLRKDIGLIIKEINCFTAVKDISLTTNGLLLEKLAQSFKTAGLNRLNISLDSIVPFRFNEITRGGDLQKVLKGIDAALIAGLSPIKINMVVMKGINDNELIPVIEFCMKKKIILRLIEFMPIGYSALFVKKRYMPVKEIRTKVAKCFSLEKTTMRGPGPAWYEYVKGDGLLIGFVSAVSRHFCQSCNRIRLTARGKLHLCLGHASQVDLAAAIRKSGASVEDLKEVIQAAVWNKPAVHCFDIDGSTANRREMSAIGG